MQDNWQHIDSFLSDTEDPKTQNIDSERYVSYRLEDLWPEWQRDARCSDVGTDYYFGEENASAMRMSIHAVRRASKLCDACPVFVECLTHALSNREEYGVWAGTSGRVRRRIFSLLDAGEFTVEEVVEVYLHGDGAQFRGIPSGGGDRVVQADRGLEHEDGWQDSQRDLREAGL